MTKEELEKLKETIAYFGHWYDVIGEERVLILEKSIKYIADLEKENAGLNCECRRCVYTDCPCVLSDYGKDRNGICDHFKDVFDENAELKSRNCWKSCEYANPKAELIGQHIKDVQNLTKAKEIISEWEDSFCCGADYLYLGNKGKELRIKSQKFLNSEIEK